MTGGRAPANDPDGLAALAGAVLERVRGRAEAQVVVRRTDTGLTRFANSFVHQNVANSSVEIELQVAAGGRVAAASATMPAEDASLTRFVEDTIAAAAFLPVDEHWPGLAGPAPVSDPGHFDAATATAAPDARVDVAAAFVDAGAGMTAAGYCDTVGTVVVYANTAGRHAPGASTRASIDGIHTGAAASGAAHMTRISIRDLDGAATGAAAAHLVSLAGRPVDVAPGEYQVVLAPECTGTLAAFLASYGFNAKAAIDGESFVRLGEARFDPAVNMWDDAFDSHAIGAGFDVEGTPKSHTDLVARGVCSGLCHDRRTARRMNTDSTGHAVPGGAVYGPHPANLTFGGGDATPDELIAAVDRGLLVTTFNYCRTLDPKRVAVTGLTRNGTFLIEGGEIVSGVRNLRFTQSFVDALAPRAVLGVGRDVRLAVPDDAFARIAAPPIRLAAWRFTGSAGPGTNRATLAT